MLPVPLRRRAAVIAALVAAAACAAEPPAPARTSVVVAVPVGPRHLDPGQPLDEFTASVVSNAWEWLTTFDADLKPVPGLAERWSTPDDHTWTFELRRGVRMHDGRILDARLAAEAFRRHIARLPELQARFAAVEARGEHQLVVTTRRVEVAVNEVAVAPIVFPAAAGAPLVGTGPYRIVSGGAGATVRLAAFEDHWAGPPPVQVLEFRVVPDEGERIDAFARGEVDVVVNLSSAGARRVLALPGSPLVSRDSLRVVLLGFDVRRPPFDDARARQAVASALDREEIVREALGGWGRVTDQVVTPEIFGHVPDPAPIRFDPAEARRLLDEAGVADRLDLELAFPRGRYQAIDEVAASVAAQLAGIGVRVKLRPEPPESVADDEPSAPLFLLGWITSHGATSSYEQLFHTRAEGLGSANKMGWSDPAVDAALRQASREPAAEQRELLVSVGRRVRETMPVVPLYRQRDLYAVAPGLRFEPRAQRLIAGRDLRWR